MILRRLPDSRFSEVLPLWQGETAVVIGCGGSLTLEQIDLVRECDLRVVAVNDAFLWADFADVHYSADAHWHFWVTRGYSQKPNGVRVPYDKPKLGLTADQVKRRWAEFGGQKCTIENSGATVEDDRVHMLRNRAGPREHSYGLSLDRQYLITGRNSGFQALNLTVLAGAKRIMLLGFDGQPGAQEHFHGGYPRPTPASVYPDYRHAMRVAREPLLRAGVTVLNCSPGSAIDAFPHAPLEHALLHAEAA